MSTLVRRELHTRIGQMVDRYFEGNTNRMNLMDIGAALDLWFRIIDRVR